MEKKKLIKTTKATRITVNKEITKMFKTNLLNQPSPKGKHLTFCNSKASKIGVREGACQEFLVQNRSVEDQTRALC